MRRSVVARCCCTCASGWAPTEVAVLARPSPQRVRSQAVCHDNKHAVLTEHDGGACCVMALQGGPVSQLPSEDLKLMGAMCSPRGRLLGDPGEGEGRLPPAEQEDPGHHKMP